MKLLPLGICACLCTLSVAQNAILTVQINNDVSSLMSDLQSRKYPEPYLRDFDSDGDLDIFSMRSEYGVYLNDGSGNFSPASQTHPVLEHNGILNDIEFEDLDMDGDLDFLVAGAGFIPGYYLNNGDGTFGPVETYDYGLPLGVPFDYEVIDADLDGDNDLFVNAKGVIQDTEGYRRLLLNDGEENFSLVLNENTGLVFTRSFAADFNQDGVEDILTFGIHPSSSGNYASHFFF